MIERLVGLGFDHFFIAPGSRSTPIISAIVRHEQAQVYQSVDERSLAFMALGYAKRVRKAAIIVVTSGTAVANLYPAIVEAYTSGVPLLILSADRPYELRDTGANQTIFQPAMFSCHIKKSYDLAPPLASVAMDKSLGSIDQALCYAHDLRAGPVHVNIQLREPLHNYVSEEKWDSNQSLRHSLTFLKAHSDISEVVKKLEQSASGLIVVGELYPSEVQQQIVRLAEHLQWPIFADVSSNLCFANHHLNLRHFDILLLKQEFLANFKPELIVHIGDRIVSKRYWAWIEKKEANHYIRLSEHDLKVDPTGIFQHYAVGDLAACIKGFADSIAIKKSREITFPNFAATIEHEMHNYLATKNDNEAFFASELIRAVSEPINLFISSSMPIRDVDQCAPTSSIMIDVFVNRGASGIDGVISTAAGVALASNKPTILLIGDVAFLHDTNGLMLFHALKQPVLIVLINNSGGGIFHHLPISNEREVVTPFLDTPHNVDISSLARAHHISHVASNADNFVDDIALFFKERKTKIIEIGIDKEKNVTLHKAFYQALVGA